MRNKGNGRDNSMGFKVLFKTILDVAIVLAIISLLLNGIIRISLIVIKLMIVLVGAGLAVGLFCVMISAVTVFIVKVFIGICNKYGRGR